MTSYEALDRLEQLRRRYHSSPCCNGLNSTEIAQAGLTPVPTVTRADVVRRGLTPCSICKPPPMLTAIPGGDA